MKVMRILILTVIIITGCGGNGQSDSENGLMVAAASNFLPAFNEIAELYENKYGTSVTFSFGSTGQLTDQIENGAPFDVFAAADTVFMDRLDVNGLILPDSRKTIAFGRIGIATMEEVLLADTLEELLSDDYRHVAIANPEHAPYGLAAKQAMEKAGVWASIEGKLIRGRNITDTLTQLESGNAEAAIVAYSLIKNKEEDVSFTLLDEAIHEPLEHPAAVITGSDSEEEGVRFISFITEGEGKDIMESYGFRVPEASENGGY